MKRVQRIATIVMVLCVAGCSGVRMSHAPSAMSEPTPRLGGTCLVKEASNVSDRVYETGNTYWSASLDEGDIEPAVSSAVAASLRSKGLFERVLLAHENTGEYETDYLCEPELRLLKNDITTNPIAFVLPTTLLGLFGLPLTPCYTKGSMCLAVRISDRRAHAVVFDYRKQVETSEASHWMSWSVDGKVLRNEVNRLLALQMTDLEDALAKGFPRRGAPVMPLVAQAAPGSPSVAGDRWAVVIGISTYADSRVPSLRYGASDARAFYDWAVRPDGGRYAPSRVKLLVDDQATCENIREALFVWLKQALAEDTVTIYFAGHGSPESPDSPENLFLLPHDVRYDRISTTAFPMWDIETALKRYIKAKRVVVIADACHSGGVGQSFDIARRAERGLKANPISAGIQNLSRVGDGVCVISASDKQQYSQEGKAWGGGHGVFTFFLLKGLRGEADYNTDGSITLGELTSYVSQEVRRATKNAQSPTVAGRYDPALTISR